MNVMVFGKLIGGVLGWSSAGLIGLAVTHLGCEPTCRTQVERIDPVDV